MEVPDLDSQTTFQQRPGLKAGNQEEMDYYKDVQIRIVRGDRVV